MAVLARFAGQYNRKTPICSPGLPSIEAALAPAQHDYLFYVAGKDGKAHLFAKTFAEHQANIARVRQHS